LIFKWTTENAGVFNWYAPIPVNSEEYGADAKRPSYSVMDAGKFNEAFEYTLPDWYAQFLHCVNE